MDCMHLALPDMRLDTFPRRGQPASSRHVGDFTPELVYTPHPDVNLDHRSCSTRSLWQLDRFGPECPATLDVRADVQHRVDACSAELVRPELVRRHRRGDRAEGGRLRALRDGAARVPASAQRAGDPRRRGVLRRELRVRARGAVRPRSGPRVGVIRALARWPQLLVVLALLGATAAAFAVTERLKLERSPVTGTRVDHVFSPVCECARDVAVISFRLRRPETVTVDILDKDGRSVRRSYASATSLRPGSRTPGTGSDEIRANRSGGRVPPACAARAERAHDHPAEPDPGGHDRTDHRSSVSSASVLARRRRPARSRDCELPHRRARSRRHARRWTATRAEQIPAARRQARLVRTGQREDCSSGDVRDSSTRRRPCG